MLVVDVRHFRTPEQRSGVVYVGRRFAGWRGHELANPFKIVTSIEECLGRYTMWLLDRPLLKKELQSLLEDTKDGQLPLGCWCGNWPENYRLKCHAVILAQMIDRFILQ